MPLTSQSLGNVPSVPEFPNEESIIYRDGVRRSLLILRSKTFLSDRLSGWPLFSKNIGLRQEIIYNPSEDFMIDGLWTAEFGSNTGGFGGGVVVIQNGKLMGGDGGHFFSGEFKLIDKTFQAKINVSPFIDDYSSMFNTQNQPFTLDLAGSLINEREMKGQGYVLEQPRFQFGVKLIKRI